MPVAPIKNNEYRKNREKILLTSAGFVDGPNTQERIGYDTNLLQGGLQETGSITSNKSTDYNHNLFQSNESVNGLGIIKGNIVTDILTSITEVNPTTTPTPPALAIDTGYYITGNGTVTIGGVPFLVSVGNIIAYTKYGYTIVENIQNRILGDTEDYTQREVLTCIDSLGNIAGNPLRLGFGPGQKIAFWGATPQVQLITPTGYPLSGAATLSQVITTLNDTIAKLQSLGIFS